MRPVCFTRFVIACLTLTAVCSTLSAVTGDNWPGWRGDGDAVSGATNLPVQWDRKTNILWRKALAGEGNSSPIVYDGKVYLAASANKGATRRILCLSAADGALVWQTDLPDVTATKTYAKTGWAAPTPVTDGERVYAFFDSPGLVAVNVDGSIAWGPIDLGPYKAHYNMAASPVLCGDLVVIVCDHQGQSFLLAADKATGEIRWRVKRDAPANSATPTVISVDGVRQIVVPSPTTIAYDDSGAELWRCAGMKPYVTPTATYDGQYVYLTSGRNGPTMFIDPRGRGDIAKTHVVAHLATGGPYVPSPVIYPHLMLPGDNGKFQLVDKTGKVVFTDRVKGRFTASPVAGDGKIYWCDEKGRTVVLDVSAAGGDKPAVKVLAINELKEKILASPAIADGRLFIRTVKALYCIEGSAEVDRKVAKSRLPKNYEALVKMYDASMALGFRKASEESQTARRLEIIGQVARLHKTPEAVAFLAKAAEKDPHWDVREEAVKLLGSYGTMAETSLIHLLVVRDRKGRPTRPYTRIVACGHLGEMKSVAAIADLKSTAGAKDHLVRVAAVEALGKIAQGRPEQAKEIVPALEKALDDGQSTVVRAGIEAIGGLGEHLGDQREAIVAKLAAIAAGQDRLAAEAAAKTMERLGK